MCAPATDHDLDCRLGSSASAIKMYTRIQPHIHFTELEMRQRPSDLEELQAAGSPPSTLMQSLETVTDSIRDVRHVQEITDLLAPSDSEKF